MTYAEIGEAVGLTTGAIGDLASGRTESPRGDAALALHQLHLDRCASKPSRKSA